MKYLVSFPNGGEHEVEVQRSGTGEVTVSVAGKSYHADLLARGASAQERLPTGAFNVLLDGKVVDLWLEGEAPDIGVIAHGARLYARAESERMRALGGYDNDSVAGTGLIASPMPGRVVRVLVGEGDEVERGTPVVVVEAMKMENELCAERDGKVAKVYVESGTAVEGGAKLIELE